MLCRLSAGRFEGGGYGGAGGQIRHLLGQFGVAVAHDPQDRLERVGVDRLEQSRQRQRMALDRIAAGLPVGAWPFGLKGADDGDGDDDIEAPI